MRQFIKRPEFVEEVLTTEDVVKKFMNTDAICFFRTVSSVYEDLIKNYLIYRIDEGKWGVDYKDKKLIEIRDIFSDFYQDFNKKYMEK